MKNLIIIFLILFYNISFAQYGKNVWSDNNNANYYYVHIHFIVGSCGIANYNLTDTSCYRNNKKINIDEWLSTTDKKSDFYGRIDIEMVEQVPEGCIRTGSYYSNLRNINFTTDIGRRSSSFFSSFQGTSRGYMEVIILPKIGNITTKTTNNDDKCENFTEEDTIIFISNKNEKLAVFKKNGDNYTKVNSFLYEGKTAVIAKYGETRYYVKSIKNGCYSSNYIIKDLTIFGKPELKINKKFYVYNNNYDKVTFKITKIPDDYVKIQLIRKGENTNEYETKENHFNKNDLNKNKKVTDLLETPYAFSAGSYILEIESYINDNNNNNNDISRGFSKYFFKVDSLPTFTVKNKEINVTCPNYKTTIRLNPNITDNLKDAKIEYGIEQLIYIEGVGLMPGYKWQTTPYFYDKSVGTYKFKYRYTVGNKVIGTSDEFTVTVNSKYSKNITFTKLDKIDMCDGKNIIFDITTSGDPNYNKKIIVEYYKNMAQTLIVAMPEVVSIYPVLGDNYTIRAYYKNNQSKECLVTQENVDFNNNYTPMSIVEATNDDISFCENNKPAKIQLKISGGQENYTFKLMRGNTTVNTVTQLDTTYIYEDIKKAGNYTVIVKDDNKCEISQKYNIPIKNKTTYSYTYTDCNYCENNNDGSIKVNIKNMPTGGYTATLYKKNTDNNYSEYKPLNNNCNFSGLTSGTYRYTINFNYGCNNTSNNIKISLKNKLKFSSVNTTRLKGCLAKSNAKIAVKIAGGSGSNKFVLKKDNSVIQQSSYISDDSYTFTSLSSGTYIVTVITENSSCSIDTTVTIDSVVNNKFSINSLNIKDVTGCYSNANGEVSVSLSGDYNSNNLFYKIGENDTYKSLNGNKFFTGKHKNTTLYVTDNVCFASKNLKVNGPDKITFYISKSSTYDCYTRDNLVVNDFTDNITSEVNDFSFSIDGTNWQDSPVFKNLEPNTDYSVYVCKKDDKNCKSDSKIYKFNTPEKLLIQPEFTDSSVLCFADNITLNISAKGGNGGYSYYYKNVNNNQENTIDNSAIDFVAGAYKVWATDSKSCKSDTATVKITQPPKITLEVTKIDSATCGDKNDGAVSFKVNNCSTLSKKAYLYSGTGAIIDSISMNKNDSIATFGNVYTGTYYIKIINKNECSFNFNNFKIPVKNSPKFTGVVTDVMCYGDNSGEIKIINNDNKSYTLRLYDDEKAYASANLSENGSVVFNNLYANTYSLELENEEGCKYNDSSYTVKQNREIKAELSFIPDSTPDSNDGIIMLKKLEGELPFNFYLYDADNNKTDSILNVENSCSFGNLSSGSYTIKTVDINNCETLYYGKINKPDKKLTINIDSSNCKYVSCPDKSDGEISVLAEGGWDSRYKFKLEGQVNVNKQPNNIFKNLPKGKYKVFVIDSMEVEASVDFEIKYPDLSTDISVKDVACFGDSTASVTFNISVANDTNPVFLNFSGNAVKYKSPVTFNNLPKNNYNYSIKYGKDSKCAFSDFIEVKQPAKQLEGDYKLEYYNGYNISCYGGTTSIALSASGGTPYSANQQNNRYIINIYARGDTIPLNSNSLKAGEYDIVYTDSNNCTTNKTVTVTQPDLPVTIDSVLISEPLCFGDTNATVAVFVSGGLASYTVSIKGSDTKNGNIGQTVTGKNISFEKLPYGKYHIEVIDANKCSTDTVIFINQPDSINFTVNRIKNIKCYGDTTGLIQLNIVGGNKPYMYSLNGNNPVYTDTVLTLLNLSAQKYTIQISDKNNCRFVKKVKLTQPEQLNTVVEQNNYNGMSVRCFGLTDTIKIKTSGGVGRYNLMFLSDSVGFSGDTLYTDISAGDYNVLVKDENGCIISKDFTVTQPDKVDIDNLYIKDVSCYADSSGIATIETKGGIRTKPFVYHFEGIDTTVYSNTIVDNYFTKRDSLRAGVYKVIVTDNNNCSVADTFSIKQPDPVSIELFSQSVKCKSTATGAISSKINNGTSPYNYIWKNSNNQIIGNKSFIDSMPADTYTLFIKDANGCRALHSSDYPNASAVISEPEEQLQLMLVDYANPLCYGDENGKIQVKAKGGWGDYVYKQNGIIYLSTPYYYNLKAGHYQLTVEDKKNCIDTINIELKQNNKLKITDLTVKQVTCYGDSTGKISIAATGGTGIYNYSVDNINWQTENTFIHLPQHTYTVCVKDTNNCITTQDTTVNQPEIISIQNTTVTNAVSCDNTGKIKLEINGGTPPYQYTWDEAANNQTDNTAENLKPGIYYVTVSDNNGCSKKLFAGTVNRNDAPKVSLVEKHNATCKTTPDGSLQIKVDFEGDVSVTWKTPESMSGDINGTTVENLLPGIYKAEISTQGSCFSYYVDTIFAPDNLKINLSADNVNCKGQQTGKININISGGVKPYSVTWIHNNQILGTNTNYNNVEAGWYKVKVNDNSSCAHNNDYIVLDSVKVYEPDNYLDVAVNALQHNKCFGEKNGYINLTGTGGSGNYVFADNLLLFSSNTFFDNLAAGKQQFYVKDMANCIDSVDVIIKQPAELLSEVDLTDINCFGLNNGSVVVNSSGGTAPYQYKLSLYQIFGLSNKFSNLTNGSYSVLVKDANKCLDTVKFTVIQPEPITLSLDSLKNAWCDNPNGYIKIKVNGGTSPYNVIWNDSHSQLGLEASKLSEGIYTARVIDYYQCETTDTFKLINFKKPELSITDKKSPLCSYSKNGSIKISQNYGNAPFYYNWFNAPHTDSLSSELLSKGDYAVAVCDKYNCADTVFFTIDAPDSLTVTDVEILHPLCYNDNSGKITVTATGGTGNYTYKWGNNNNLPANTNLSAGTYYLTVSDQNACLFTTSYSLENPEKLTVNLIDKQDSWCYQTNAYLKVKATGGTGEHKYRWTDFENQNSNFLSQISVGQYNVNVTDDNNCSIDSIFEILNIQGPVLTVKKITDALCSYSLNGKAELITNNGTAPFIYTWDNGIQTSTPVFDRYNKGSHSVVVTDFHNCSDTLKFNIGAPDSLYVLLADIKDPTCFGYSNGYIKLSTHGGTAPYMYSWSNGQKTDSIFALAKGDYFVNVKDANNCKYDKSYYLLNPEPIIVSLESDVNICSNQTAHLDAGNPGMEYYWYNNNGFESFDRTIDVSEQGTYFVEVTDFNSCLGFDSAVVNVSQEKIESNFLLRSVAYVGDTIVMVEISWPVPESIEWHIPQEFTVIDKTSNEVEFIVNSEGTFNVGLTTYNDICTEFTEKIINVKPASQKPPGYKSVETGIIKSVSVKPNPAEGPFNLEIILNREHSVTIEILMVSGVKRFVKKLSGNKQYILNFSNSNIADGVHTIRVIAGNEVKTQKLIIAK